MNIISLLGMILDRMAFPHDVELWNYEGDYIKIMIEATPEMKLYAESLIDECYDFVNVERDKYDYITITFKDDRINKVYYGKEEHDVRDTIDNYVNDWHIEDIYLEMCKKIISLLPLQV